MNRIDRLTAILIQLQTRRVLPAREIAGRYGISLRTVYRDIRALEEAGIPVGAEPGRGYFLAEGYRLPPVMFTPDEAGALLLGGKLIEKFSDRSANQHFAGALDKIKAVLGESDQDYLNQLDDRVTVLSMAPRDQGQVPESRLIALQSVLADNRAVIMDYHSNSRDERTRRTVEPLGLCFYAGNWHLLAFCHLRREYRDFRVDRIKSLEPTGRQFDRSRHGDLDRLVRHIVLPAELKPATLRFTPRAARRIGDQKYYFGFVRQYEQDAGIAMEFLVPDYDYMARWLLSFLDQVTVISPASLEQTLATHVRKLTAHYLAPKKKDDDSP
jgi:predicted DNA-binding transcriptional regulator YafY